MRELEQGESREGKAILGVVWLKRTDAAVPGERASKDELHLQLTLA